MKNKAKVVVYAAILICIAAFTYLKTEYDFNNTTLTVEKKKEVTEDLTKESITTDCYEDDTIIECTITNNSKKDAERVEVVYYVYNDKDECVYQVGDIFSLDAGESKYTDLDMCPDYSYTEIKVFEVY